MSKLILSLDGGGIRGAATARFLSLLEAELAKRETSIREQVDFFAGTSTGSIIALALATAKHLTVDQIDGLYSPESAAKIFKKNEGWFEVDGVNAPKYEAEGKRKQLEANLGEVTIGDVAEGKHVLAVTFDVEKRKPLVIKSTDPEHRRLKSYKVADASSAAPTYFPTIEMDPEGDNEQQYLIDGGVTANNPTMCAIAEAKEVWQNISVDDLRVLSIGTGYPTRKINGPESSKWGAIQWFTKGHILDVLQNERVVAYQARTITKTGNYIRVNSELRAHKHLLMQNPPDDAMDDISVKNINRLKRMGDFWFEKYGEAVISFVLGNYNGASLDRIDPVDENPGKY